MLHGGGHIAATEQLRANAVQTGWELWLLDCYRCWCWCGGAAGLPPALPEDCPGWKQHALKWRASFEQYRADKKLVLCGIICRVG